jgi:hypothetical protein
MKSDYYALSGRIKQSLSDIQRVVDRVDLTLQMSTDSEKLRPRVIITETRYCLDEYRGFRHIVRNVYTFHFKASRLEELANGIRPCYQLVEKDLNSFNDFLLKTAR